jgi:uncharacterized protein (TIGR03437 family)
LTAVANAGSGGSAVSFNSVVTIWGKNLSSAPVPASTFPWPNTLGSTQVSFCDATNGSNTFWLSNVGQGTQAQLTDVSPNPINAVLPDETTKGLKL